MCGGIPWKKMNKKNDFFQKHSFNITPFWSMYHSTFIEPHALHVLHVRAKTCSKFKLDNSTFGYLLYQL